MDAEDSPIRTLFKLIPWEWWLDDEFGSQQLINEAMARRIAIIEPAWKMVASNKRLLVTLADMYPNHPLILPARADGPDPAWTSYVRKPVRGREGANVEIVDHGEGPGDQ